MRKQPVLVIGIFVLTAVGAGRAADTPNGHVAGRVGVASGATANKVVRLEGRSFWDQRGPFLGLGASYFQALRHAKHDRERLNRNLALLASKGFNYVRVLSMVSWDGLEIAPVTFKNRAGRVVAAWPDYWQQFRELLDLAGRHGLRVEVTIFADAQYVMPDRPARQAHLDAILANLSAREHRVLHLEVANEAWQNGFPGAQGIAQLREFAKYLADRTDVLVAITSNDDTSEKGIVALYRGSAADLATVHFSRDTRTSEGGWLPVRDPYRLGNLPGVPPVSSNEPIGPGASVGSESDPTKLCSAAVFAYLANLPAYVYHCRAGIYGYARCCPPAGGEERFEDSAGINAYRFLHRILPPDLSSWTRNDGIEPAAPLTVFCNRQPNRYWPETTRPADGCVRNIGAVQGNRFVCFPMGILGDGVTLEARRSVRFQVVAPLTGEVVSNVNLKAGQRLTLPQGPGVYICKGSFLDHTAKYETSVALAVNPARVKTSALGGKPDTASPDRPLIGVSYFAGWWKPLPNKWHYDPAIGDWRAKFPQRVPLLGEYNDQPTMDKEIVAAAQHGVDFFLILWYYNGPNESQEREKNSRFLNEGVKNFVKSPEACRMSFAIEYCNHEPYQVKSADDWNHCLKTWVAAMCHPSYLRVGGRLVFKVHSWHHFWGENGKDAGACRARLDGLRKAVREAGLGEMIIGCGIASGEKIPRGHPAGELFDFTGTYMEVPSLPQREADYPYEKLAEFARPSRVVHANDRIPYLPYLGAGFNARPWPDQRAHFAIPTKDEWTRELQTMKADLERLGNLGFPLPDGRRRKALTIYAWNEFGEGGFLAPTKGESAMKLQSIQEVFERP